MKQRDLEENDEGMLMCVRVHNKKYESKHNADEDGWPIACSN